MEHVPVWYELALASSSVTFRGTCSAVEILKGYTVREKFGTKI